ARVTREAQDRSEESLIERHFDAYSEQYRRQGLTKTELITGYRLQRKRTPGLRARDWLGTKPALVDRFSEEHPEATLGLYFSRNRVDYARVGIHTEQQLIDAFAACRRGQPGLSVGEFLAGR